MRFEITPIEPVGHESVPLLSGDVVPNQPMYAKHEKSTAFKLWWRARREQVRSQPTLADLAEALELEVHEASGLMHGRYECDWEELHRRLTAAFPRDRID